MAENVIEVSDQDFEGKVLHSERPVLVDFWAEWCTPCHIVLPVVEELAREQVGKLRAVKLNVAAWPGRVMPGGGPDGRILPNSSAAGTGD